MRHETAETRFVDACGVQFAYRRFGSPGATPLVVLQHFRGNLDNRDRALTDALAREREVNLVDYPGAGSSSGKFGPPNGQVTTKPSLTAKMVKALALLGTERVLEVGTGLGFQTAVLAKRAREAWSVERWRAPAEAARVDRARCASRTRAWWSGTAPEVCPDWLRSMRSWWRRRFRGFPGRSPSSSCPAVGSCSRSGPGARRRRAARRGGAVLGRSRPVTTSHFVPLVFEHALAEDGG